MTSKPWNAADRFCTSWACVGAGSLIGFGACLYLQISGYSTATNRLIFDAIVLPVGGFILMLPRVGLEIIRLSARHRRLVRGESVDPAATRVEHDR
jgi:hypothetical protein